MHKRRGAIFVELVLVLPLFIVLILLVLWIAFTTNETTSLQFAVTNGVRLASTRGSLEHLRNNGSLGNLENPQKLKPPKPDLGLGMSLVDAMGKYAASDRLETDNNMIKKWLTSENIPDWEGQYANFLNTYSKNKETPEQESLLGGSGNNSCKFEDMPSRYFLALAYINKYMQESLGGSVRFPCDPDGKLPNNGPGCMRCYLTTPYIPQATIGDQCPYPADYFSMRCDYRGNNFMMEMLSYLGKVLGKKDYALISAESHQRLPVREWIYE